MSSSEQRPSIGVTKTFLPPLKDYQAYLGQIWSSARVTTFGPLAIELMRRLEEYLEVDHLLLVSSGTSALQVAIQTLQLEGEIITTPFTYVATVSSIAWTGRDPVLVDIDPNTLAIDPNLVEAAISSRTSAILATHIYGHPCDTDALEQIAKRHGIKLLFDAAACFGVRYQGRPLVDFGDLSVLSFHATKIFHTVEGGGIVSPSRAIHDACIRAHNQGHIGQDRGIDGLGTNAKNSEFHAAMGLSVLPFVPELIQHRRQLCELYDEHLHEIRELRSPRVLPGTEKNYSYYPLVFNSEQALLQSQSELSKHGIGTRRYFYPSLSTLDYLKRCECPIAENVAGRVLCLPLSHDMNLQDASKITDIIRKTF